MSAGIRLRLWMSPIRYQGVRVWIGQISRDIGVRLTAKTIITRKVDPDVDETREYLVENLAYSQALAELGYVDGVGAAPLDEPRGDLTGDPYFSGGYRVVLWLSSRPTDIVDIEILDRGELPVRWNCVCFSVAKDVVITKPGIVVLHMPCVNNPLRYEADQLDIWFREILQSKGETSHGRVVEEWCQSVRDRETPLMRIATGR